MPEETDDFKAGNATETDIMSQIDGVGNDETVTKTEEPTNTQETTITTETPTATDSKATTLGVERKPEEKPAGGPQDLKDKDGNTIATGGADRRHYENWQREVYNSKNLTQQVTNLTSQVEAYKSAGGLGQQFNLTPEELTTGAQMISAYKENPVEMVKYLLTTTQAKGHNVEGGTDMSAIKSMIDGALAPLLDTQSKTIAEQEALDAATEYRDQFYGTYPDAVVHEATLTQLLNQDKTMSPEAVYFKLKNFYLEHGHDFSKSLQTLAEEEKAAKPVVKNEQESIPNSGVLAGNVTDSSEIADVNTSYADIIRQAMEEQGLVKTG